MHEDFGWLSVNQMIAEVRLVEAWKIVHDPSSPLHGTISFKESHTNVVITRSQHHPILDPGRPNKIARNSFAAPTALVWNSAPNCIKEAKSCLIAKKLIRNYVKNLPL